MTHLTFAISALEKKNNSPHQHIHSYISVASLAAPKLQTYHLQTD